MVLESWEEEVPELAGSEVTVVILECEIHVDTFDIFRENCGPRSEAYVEKLEDQSKIAMLALVVHTFWDLR